MWPLGINPGMDEHAKKHGLEHWSCTSPMTNDCWIRQDGEVLRPDFLTTSGYLGDLRKFDQENTMQESIFKTDVTLTGKLRMLTELMDVSQFQQGDIIEIPNQGYVQWVSEEEAKPNRILREIRQKEIRRVIEFTKEKYR